MLVEAVEPGLFEVRELLDRACCASRGVQRPGLLDQVLALRPVRHQQGVLVQDLTNLDEVVADHHGPALLPHDTVELHVVLDHVHPLHSPTEVGHVVDRSSLVCPLVLEKRGTCPLLVRGRC